MKAENTFFAGMVRNILFYKFRKYEKYRNNAQKVTVIFVRLTW